MCRSGIGEIDHWEHRHYTSGDEGCDLDENRLPFRIESYERSSDGVCLPNDIDPIYTRCFFGMGLVNDLYKKNGMVYSDIKDGGTTPVLNRLPIPGFSTNRILDSEGKIINSSRVPRFDSNEFDREARQSPSTINSGSYCGYFAGNDINNFRQWKSTGEAWINVIGGDHRCHRGVLRVVHSI